MLTPTALTLSDSVPILEGISSAVLENSIHQPPTPHTPELDAKLGWILLQKRWISAAQLQAALLQQSQLQQSQLQQSHQQFQCPKKLGELLVEQAMLSAAQLKDALQEQYWRRQGYWVI